MTDLVLILLLSAPVCISQLWVKAAEQSLAQTLLKKKSTVASEEQGSESTLASGIFILFSR